MKFIKNNKVLIVIVLVLLVLIIIRSTGLNHFKNDSKRWAEPSIKKSNTITLEQAGTIPGNKLIINVDKDDNVIREITGEAENISADSVLGKKHLSEIRKHDGPVLLFSSDPGLSARIWMILSQMGSTNIYILTNRADNEIFKYKFQPDTLLHGLE